MSRRYLIVFAAITSLVVLALGSFNWFMNPHGLFRSPVIDGLNVMKPKMGFYERQLKAYQASRLVGRTCVQPWARPG